MSVWDYLGIFYHDFNSCIDLFKLATTKYELDTVLIVEKIIKFNIFYAIPILGSCKKDML